MVIYTSKKYRRLLALVYSVAVFQSKRMTNFVGNHMVRGNLGYSDTECRPECRRVDITWVNYPLHEIQLHTISRRISVQ